MTLRKKLVKGGIWNGAVQSSTWVIRFFLSLLLARLLGPDTFGLIAMVLIFTGFIGYFTEFGLISSLIHKKNIDELDCNTTLWASMVISAIIYGIVYAIAPLIALFNHQPQLTLITRVIFLDFLIRPFSFVPAALEMKKLKYNILSITAILTIAVSAVISVAMAYAGFGVWALVAQQLGGTVINVILMAIFTRYKPKFQFSFERLKGLFSFGIHVLFNNLIKFFSENIDYLLVGRLLGDKILGIYTISFRLSRYPLEKIWSLFGKMLFPAFTSIKDDRARLQKNYLRVSVAGSLVLIPPLMIIFFAADLIIKILGSKWADSADQMALVIRIFSGYLVFQTCCYADESMLTTLKKVHILNIYKLSASIILVSVGYFAVKSNGFIGMAWTYMIVTFVMVFVVKILTLRTLGIGILKFFSCFGFVTIYFVVNMASGIILAHYREKFPGDITYLVSLLAVFAVVPATMLISRKVLLLKKPFLEVDHIINFV